MVLTPRLGRPAVLSASLFLCLGCPEDPTPPDAAADLLPIEAPDLGEGDLAAPADLRPVGTRVRIVASNLSSGNRQSYDPGEGIRILQGLRPDVALVQELNYGSNSETDLRTFVDTAFGPSFSYFRQPTGNIPNGVVSRFPILGAGVWDDPLTTDREIAWARIDAPGPKDLWAVSVHLLTSSGTNRDNEARALVGFVKDKVPAGDYLVIGGDLNTDNRTEACLATLAQIVVSTLPEPPADHLGNGNTNASRAKPYDWVLADADLDPLQVPVLIGGSSYRSGLVFDSRIYAPLGEVAPAQMGDSGAPSMQHMAVVRDFSLPD